LIKLSIFWNKLLVTATSANWNVNFLLYRGGMVSSAFITDPSLSAERRCGLAGVLLLYEVGALAAP
jgi:hypothetical protein